MISPDYVRMMARYNQWQNQSLYTASDGLNEAERLLDRGAFFGSIQGTFSHLLWGDQQWMSRFAGLAKPQATGEQSAQFYSDWQELKQLRIAFDQTIINWAVGLDAQALSGVLSWYSGLMKCDYTKPLWGLIVHFINHQTHYRGQVHARLTAAGARPDDTDLILLQGFGEM
jgi:uncharacterized damage-inducible protein DinB